MRLLEQDRHPRRILQALRQPLQALRCIFQSSSKASAGSSTDSAGFPSEIDSLNRFLLFLLLLGSYLSLSSTENDAQSHCHRPAQAEPHQWLWDAQGLI